uniref:ANK_REP_REGION domain-containing protein n=1 Tax=Globodera pallida TaxID=36090 RepID=A0A183CPX7_GLOPA
QPIKFVDYVRWRKSVNIALGVTDETTELNEKHSRFTAHEAQWRMNKRGMEGETLVHLLLNRQELVCQEVARILINRYPGLAKDIYLGEELFGQSCLHLAIVHDDYVTAKTLLEYGASVNARANGDFFMPEGFEPGGDHRGMDYEGYAYYGEYPLAFAACFENKDIYDLLIQYGANPDKQDTFGNTISMYSYSARHWHRPAHRLENFAGQTPLTLATKLGRKQIFEEMLELMKVEFWRFSDMTCSAYPLDALDTIRSDGSTNYDSALMTVLAGGTTEHLEMVNSEVIQRLLADKWDAFGRRKLFERLALLVVHLVALGLVVYLRPPNADQLYMQQPEASDWARTGAELLAILCSCWFVFVQQMDELRCNGIRAYLWQTSTVPAKMVYLIANLCFLACVPLRFIGCISDY